MWTIDALGKQARAGVAAESILPIDAALGAWPELRLEPDETERFRRGMELSRPDLEWTGDCRVYGADGMLCALGERNPYGSVRPRRVFLLD
jgi:tRNA pseudouridine55 synthase